jgi:hypothetical protein
LERKDVAAGATASRSPASGRHAKEEHVEDLLWRDLVLVKHEVSSLRILCPTEPHPASTSAAAATSEPPPTSQTISKTLAHIRMHHKTWIQADHE